MAASRADVEAFRRALAGLSALARRELTTVWRSLDLEDRAAFTAILEASTDVVTGYGDAAAVAGLDFYEDLRARHTELAPYRGALPPPTPEEQIQASARWALAQPDPYGNLMKVADRLTKAPGRLAIEQSMNGDPSNPRYARVPSGAETCLFCAMLASRGAVYHSEQSAGAGHDYHDFCDCSPVPVFGTELPEGYDPDHYLDIYMSAGGADIDLSGSRSPSVRTSR